MSFNRNNYYFVLNENDHAVYFPTRDGGFMINAAHDGIPAMRQVHFEDIVAANSSSSIFKEGNLFFEKEYEDAIYKELRIPNWKDIWHNSDIEKIIENPTMEELQKIVDSKSKPFFARVRGVYVGMKNANMNISNKARSVIEERQLELERGILNSAICLVPKAKSEDASSEIAELRKMVEDLKEEKKNSEPTKKRTYTKKVSKETVEK